MKLHVLILLACLNLIHAKVWNLSCAQIRRFVDGHNSRRLKLAKGVVPGQPPAAEMKMMVWDEELAAKAEKWARKNVFKHNPDKTIASKRFNCGENLYVYKTTEKNYRFDPDIAMENWFGEHKDFSYRPLQNEDFGNGPQIGHYTQMAWSDTTHVGCAVSQYRKEPKWNSFLVVCNYGPTGNYIDREPYKTGRACKTLSCQGSHCNQKYGDKCKL